MSRVIVAFAFIALLLTAPAVSAGPRSDALAMLGIAFTVPDAITDGQLTVSTDGRIAISGETLTVFAVRESPVYVAMVSRTFPQDVNDSAVSAIGGVGSAGAYAPAPRYFTTASSAPVTEWTSAFRLNTDPPGMVRQAVTVASPGDDGGEALVTVLGLVPDVQNALAQIESTLVVH